MFIERRETVVVLYPEGEITREYESELQQLVQTVEKYLAKGERKFAVSLKGVIHIDTSGLGAIFGLYKKVTAAGGKLGLAEIPDRLMRVVEVMDIPSIIKVSDTIEDVISLLK